MKLNRWAVPLQNSVVGIVLALMIGIPALFGAAGIPRIHQLTAYGFLGLGLLVVWALRAQDRITVQKLRALALSGPNLPIMLYLGWSLLSVAFSSEPFYSQLAFLQLAFGGAIYGVVTYQFRHRAHIRALLAGLLVVAVTLVLAALAMNRGGGLTRLSGALNDPQFFGAFLGLVLPVLLGVAAGTRNPVWKIGAQVSAVLVAGGLLLTGCRSAWLGTLVAIALFAALSFAFVWKAKSLGSNKHNLLITPALAIVALALFVSFSNQGAQLMDRVATLKSVRTDASVQDRVHLQGVARKVISQNPVLGVGLGNYALGQVAHNVKSRPEPMIRQIGPSLSENPHNIYLQVAAEQGLVGLGFYLAILGAFFWYAFRALPKLERGLRQYTLIGCVAAMAGQMVDGMNNPGWAYPEVATFFWLILGVGMCAAGLGQEVREERTAEAAAPVLGMPVFLYRGLRTAAIGCATLALGYQLINLNASSAAAHGKHVAADRGVDTKGNNANLPFYCAEATAIDVDFLNDDIPPPQAFAIDQGAIGTDPRNGGRAVFQLYALTGSTGPNGLPDEYANITNQTRFIRVTFPDEVVGGVRRRNPLRNYAQVQFSRGDNPRIILVFRRPPPVGRGESVTGTVRFEYLCGDRTLRTEFDLTVFSGPAPQDPSFRFAINNVRTHVVGRG